jgi:hypothetical protein
VLNLCPHSYLPQQDRMTHLAQQVMEQKQRRARQQAQQQPQDATAAGAPGASGSATTDRRRRQLEELAAAIQALVGEGQASNKEHDIYSVCRQGLSDAMNSERSTQVQLVLLSSLCQFAPIYGQPLQSTCSQCVGCSGALPCGVLLQLCLRVWYHGIYCVPPCRCNQSRSS